MLSSHAVGVVMVQEKKERGIMAKQNIRPVGLPVKDHDDKAIPALVYFNENQSFMWRLPGWKK